jgi:hypothetical protein
MASAVSVPLYETWLLVYREETGLAMPTTGRCDIDSLYIGITSGSGHRSLRGILC